MKEVKNMSPDIRSMWHHRNNLVLDGAGVVWPRRSGDFEGNQLLVPKQGRKGLFKVYHTSASGGHLGRSRTVSRLQGRFYWMFRNGLMTVQRVYNGNHLTTAAAH